MSGGPCDGCNFVPALMAHYDWATDRLLFFCRPCYEARKAREKAIKEAISDHKGQAH